MATMQCHKPIEQTHNHMESTVVGQKTTTQTCYKANNEHSLTNKVKEMANSACKMFTEHKHQEHHGQNGGNHTHHVAKTRTSVNHESHANAHMHQSAHQGYTATTDKKKKAGHGHRAKLGVAKAHTSVNHESHASGHMHESAYQEPCPNTATAAPTDKKKKEGHGGNCIPGIGEHIKNMKKKKNSKAGKRSDSSSDSSSSCDDESDNKTSGKNKN